MGAHEESRELPGVPTKERPEDVHLPWHLSGPGWAIPGSQRDNCTRSRTYLFESPTFQ